MRFYHAQHKFYCGIDLHARTLDVCILDHKGEILVHRPMQAGPDPFLKTMAPSREDLVVCVACLFTWYGLADLWARDGMPCVLGPALSMQAIHGGKAKNDTSDAQKIAGLLRGGRLPPADVSPAKMRATRDLLRRRMPLRRTRAELLTHIPQTNRQYNLPERGNTLASTANRDGVAARCTAPAVPKSLDVALALSSHYDHLLHAVELTLVNTAKQPDAQTLDRRPSVPGIGQIVRLVILDAIPDIARFPRGQDFVSSCRLVTWAKASAGQRSGHLGHEERPCVLAVGLLRGGGALPARPAGRPAIPGQTGETTWPRAGLHRPGSAIGQGGL